MVGRAWARSVRCRVQTPVLRTLSGFGSLRMEKQRSMEEQVELPGEMAAGLETGARFVYDDNSPGHK